MGSIGRGLPLPLFRITWSLWLLKDGNCVTIISPSCQKSGPKIIAYHAQVFILVYLLFVIALITFWLITSDNDFFSELTQQTVILMNVLLLSIVHWHLTSKRHETMFLRRKRHIPAFKADLFLLSKPNNPSIRVKLFLLSKSNCSCY